MRGAHGGPRWGSSSGHRCPLRLFPVASVSRCRTGAGGVFSSREPLGAQASGGELGAGAPDVLIGHGQVGRSHARGVLRGDGTGSANPKPPPAPSDPTPHCSARIYMNLYAPQLTCHGEGDRPRHSLSKGWQTRITFLQHFAGGRQGRPGRALRKIISSLLFWTVKVLPRGAESWLNRTIQGGESARINPPPGKILASCRVCASGFAAAALARPRAFTCRQIRP